MNMPFEPVKFNIMKGHNYFTSMNSMLLYDINPTTIKAHAVEVIFILGGHVNHKTMLSVAYVPHHTYILGGIQMGKSTVSLIIF
jgi:hypothetical protein